MTPYNTTEAAPPLSYSSSVAPSPLAIPYTAHGGQRRETLIAVDKAGVWSIYDLSTATRAARAGFLVQRLDGAEEELDEAVALAAEFVASQLSYARGERPDSPVGKSPLERLPKIRRDARRAAAAAAAASEELEPDWFQDVVARATANPTAAEDTPASIAA